MKNNFKFTLMVLSTFLGSFCTIQNTGAMKIETCAVCGKKVKTFLDKGCCYCNSGVSDKLNSEETMIELHTTEEKFLPNKPTNGRYIKNAPFEVNLTNKLSEKDKYHSLYWYSSETLSKYTRHVEVDPKEFCKVIDEFMKDKKRASEWKDFIINKRCGITANIFKMSSEEPITWFSIKYFSDTYNDDDCSNWLDDTEFRTLPERKRYELYGLKKPNRFSKLVMTNDGRGLWVQLNCIVREAES